MAGKKRRSPRKNFAGLVITLALHGGVLVAVALAHNKQEQPLIVPRDFVVAEMVKLGKPREKFWLPRLTQPPRAAPPDALKIAEDPNAKAAPKEAPKENDPNISKDLKRALDRARKLEALAAQEEPDEGSATGSRLGAASQAVGDQYLAEIKGMLMQNYALPAGIAPEQIQKPPEIRLVIGADGALSGIKLVTTSGNSFVDDACVNAAQETRKSVTAARGLAVHRPCYRGRVRKVAALGALALVTAGPALAQPPGGEEDLPTIRLSGAGVELLRLGIPRAEGDGDSARAAAEVMSKDMDVTGLFQVLDPTSYPQQLQSEGLSFSSALWSQVGAQAVIKMKATGGLIEGRLYVTARGDAAVLAKTYKAGDTRDAVHEFANDVVQWFTNQRGVFGSRIVFALNGRGSREIAAVDMDGGRTSVITKMGSDCLLPAFSPTGGEVAFTSYLRGNPDLWMVSAGGGRARRVTKQPGLNTGAAWSPDGRVLALTMSWEGNAEIYRVNPADGGIQNKLTTNSAIDSSPSFSPDGSQIAFVSNRQGSPQIFVMSAQGGTPKRVTFLGKYNQTPRWSPRADKPQIAFTGRDERGVFDVFVLDVKSGRVDRVTQGKGSNQDPTWSPDGRLLAYVSSRGGIFVQNPETHHEVQIWRGSASSPSWGPAPRR